MGPTLREVRGVSRDTSSKGGKINITTALTINGKESEMAECAACGHTRHDDYSTMMSSQMLQYYLNARGICEVCDPLIPKHIPSEQARKYLKVWALKKHKRRLIYKEGVMSSGGMLFLKSLSSFTDWTSSFKTVSPIASITASTIPKWVSTFTTSSVTYT